MTRTPLTQNRGRALPPDVPCRSHFFDTTTVRLTLRRSSASLCMPSSPTRRTAFALALLIGPTACEKAPAKAFVPPPAQVGVVTVAPTTLREAYEFVGQVSPFR